MMTPDFISVLRALDASERTIKETQVVCAGSIQSVEGARHLAERTEKIIAETRSAIDEVRRGLS